MIRSPFADMLESVARLKGVTAALVVNEQDGIVIEANVQTGQSADRVAALAASLYRKARLSARAAGLGSATFMQLEAPGGRLCAVSGGSMALIVVANTAVNVGLIRLELLRAGRALCDIDGSTA